MSEKTVICIVIAHKLLQLNQCLTHAVTNYIGKGQLAVISAMGGFSHHYIASLSPEFRHFAWTSKCLRDK